MLHHADQHPHHLSDSSYTTLWLDLGNTRLKYWLIQHTQQQDTVLAQGAELHLQSPTDLLRGLTPQLIDFAPQRVCVSSVLSAADNQTIANCLQPLGVSIQFATVQAHYQSLRTDYDTNKLGIDRWLQLLALADRPQHLCVVGCGTALTVDMLDHGHHLGGYIIPSLYLQRESLAQGTRKIKVAETPFTHTTLGVDTHQAVHHGVLFGLVALLEKLILDDPSRQLILTGGDALQLRDACTLDWTAIPYSPIIQNDLLLQGLQRYFTVV